MRRFYEPVAALDDDLVVETRPRWLLLGAIFMLTAFLLLLSTQCDPEPVAAQPRRQRVSAELRDQIIPPELIQETALALARVCWSERDSSVQKRDCAAIAQRHWAVAIRAGGRRTLLDVIRTYSPHATGWCGTPEGARLSRCRDAESRTRQHWVSTMRADGREPSGWPDMNAMRIDDGREPLPWGNFDDAWWDTLEEALDLVVDPPRGPCPIPPDHWGGDCNVDENPNGACDPVPPNWVRLDCGDTVNAFYDVLRVAPPPIPGGAPLPADVARGRSRP